MTIAITGIVYQLFFQDTGWTVDAAQASTAYTVNIGQGLEIQENLTVNKALEVRDDISITGSTLNMAGTSCLSETPRAALSLCFEGADSTLKASKNGGPYESIEGVAGPQGIPGTVGPRGAAGSDGINGAAGLPGATGPLGPAGVTGPTGPTGPAGADGLQCWDQNGDGQGSPTEDINRDRQVDILDCAGPVGPQGLKGVPGIDGPAGAPGTQGLRGLTGLAGSPGTQGAPGATGPLGTPGLNCWDTNRNSVGDAAEDRNLDGFIDAADCQGRVSFIGGTADLPIAISKQFAAAGEAGRLNVQFTPRNKPLLLYSFVIDTTVWICEKDFLGGDFDYLIQVLP